MRGVIVALVLLFSTPLFSAELDVRIENHQPKTLVYDQLVSKYPQRHSQPNFHGTQKLVNLPGYGSLTCSSSSAFKTQPQCHLLLSMTIRQV